jgi:ketosteroid isomerase-like protein
MLPFSQVIEQERRRWMPFRRALSKEDQAAFDRMFACATQQLQAEVPLGRPGRFEAVIMAVLLAHEKLLDQVRKRLETVSAEKSPERYR